MNRLSAGSYGISETGLFEIEELHHTIRNIPKPVIAAETARFGQAGPRVGSFDAGFGTAYLARVVGEKRAREIWFFCRQYDAQTALEWGLVNKLVPPEQLMDEARASAAEAVALSPSTLRFLKMSFNADSAQIAGQQRIAFEALEPLYGVQELRRARIGLGRAS